MQRPRRPSSNEPVSVLVIGVGHLGKEHARVYRALEGARLLGVVDRDPERAREVGSRLDVPYYHELTPALLSSVQAASVVTPTPAHFEVASKLIRHGVSVLVEKPMTSNLSEARDLQEIAKQHGATLQVGHIERFNPVVLAALPHIRDPLFIECDRIHPFSFRSVETSVVLDLMIHDIDIVLNLVDSPVAHLDAVGTRVLSGTEDLANARITFENGCAAMFKASRVAIQKNRKMRIFSANSYLSLDYVAKTGMKISLKNGCDRELIDFKKMASLEETQGAYPLFTQYFNIEQLSISSEEPLRGELQAFLFSVRTGKEPVVTGEHGVQAIDIATLILEQIKSSQKAFQRRRQAPLPESPPGP